MIYTHKDGSSLIGFMIYLVLFAWITQMVFEWSTFLMIKQTLFDQRASRLVSFATVYDLMLKDVVSAHPEKKYWQMISSAAVIFATPTCTVEWRLDNGIITRTQGMYNAVQQTWSDAKRVHFSAEVSHFSYELMYRGDQVACVKFCVGDGDHRMCGTASPAGMVYL